MHVGGITFQAVTLQIEKSLRSYCSEADVTPQQYVTAGGKTLNQVIPEFINWNAAWKTSNLVK